MNEGIQKNHPDDLFSDMTLDVDLIDAAICDYIETVPVKTNDNVPAHTEEALVKVWQSYSAKKYKTTFLIQVDEKRIMPPPSRKKLNQLSTTKNSDGTFSRRLSSRWESEQKDGSRMFILAGLVAEYLVRKGYRKLIRDGRSIDLQSSECIKLLQEDIKKERQADQTATLRLSEQSGKKATEDAFKQKEEEFLQFFFVGPEFDTDDPEKTCDHILRAWGIKPPSSVSRKALSAFFCGEDEENRARRDALRDEILKQAFGYPLFTSLRKPGKYFELYELLRQITKIDIKGNDGSFTVNALVQSPLVAIMDKVLQHPLYDSLREKTYTGYDYIRAHGEISNQAAKDTVNHTFRKSDLKEELHPYVDDAWTNGLLIRLGESDDGPFKYRTKTHRVFTSAISEALKANKKFYETPFYDRTAEEINLMLGEDGIREEQTAEDNAGIAKKHYSAHSWFSVVFLEYIDSNQRRRLLRELAKIAGNFQTSGSFRDRQEKALSIGSFFLVEQAWQLPGEQAASLFVSIYGRTMYAFQAEMWPLLKTRSRLFTEIAKQYFRQACLPKEDPTFVEKRGVPVFRNVYRQPYFNFLQGDLYTEEELRALPASFQVTIQACRLQKATWFLTPKQELAQATEGLVDKAFELLGECVRHMQEPANDILCYVYASVMTFYALANLENRKADIPGRADDVRKRLKNPSDRNTVIRAVLYSDYYSRRKNPLYPTYGEEYNVICGAIRMICAYEIPMEKGGYPIPAGLDPKTVARDYKLWLRHHCDPLHQKPRQVFLLWRLLSYYNFEAAGANPIDYIKGHNDIIEDMFSSFLPYDQMCDSLPLFAENPRKLWTEKAQEEYRKAHT